MKRVAPIMLLTVAASTLCAQQVVNIEPTYVGRGNEISIVVEFDQLLQQSSLSAPKYSLRNGNGEKIICTSVDVGGSKKFVTFGFQINSGNFVVFENLVSDSSGYFLSNDEEMRFAGGKIGKAELEPLTENKICTIAQEDWDKYILNEYSAQYLFPHSFEAGTQLGVDDSTKTVYYIGMVQSGSWFSSQGLSAFWGLKGRWSTDALDKLNYLTLYPMTLLFDKTNWRVALGTGIETGYEGFGKFGRATLRSELQYRLPFNFIDLTLGNPRWRINPVLNLSVQGNYGWGNVQLTDSLQRSVDATVALRYDIPVAKQYYLQTTAKLNYSTVTEDLLYQYGISLGYIAGGEIRIAFRYEQGFQDVSYQFDKKLLLGFAFDVLNQSAGK